jgi:hypothetical protein
MIPNTKILQKYGKKLSCRECGEQTVKRSVGREQRQNIVTAIFVKRSPRIKLIRRLRYSKRKHLYDEGEGFSKIMNDMMLTSTR